MLTVEGNRLWLILIARDVAVVVIALGVAQNLLYLVQLALAGWALARRPRVGRSSALWRILGDISPPIALLVPAYNEEATVVENIRSLRSLQYPSFEIVVINDGSTDGTLRAVIKAFDLKPIVRAYEPAVSHRLIRGLYGSPEYKNLLVVDKENGGKSDALNAGINLSRSPLFCAVDADSILEADALLRAVQPFVEEPDRMAAVGGTIRVANGCRVHRGRVTAVALPRKLLPLLQTVEYLRAFLMGRLAWSKLQSLTIVSGAFGIIRRSVAVAVGGYSRGTVGEDLEIIVKIHRFMHEHGADYAVRFVPEPVCWTEVPESLRVLARQRIRWQRGALEVFFKHMRMLLNPRYGRVGLLGFSNTFLVDVLAPPVEVIGYLLVPAFWAFGLLSVPYMLGFLAVTFAYGVFLSVGALILEEMELRRFPLARDLLVLAVVAVIENFGYRQLNNFWRIAGFWQYLRGAQGWGQMTRIGFRQV
ncbi:MAG TPA: glycosyltransferase [Stellaceae bacterium]|nr:glycosyltransferase [Stellaceae bacterium]